MHTSPRLGANIRAGFHMLLTLSIVAGALCFYTLFVSWLMGAYPMPDKHMPPLYTTKHIVGKR
jgi:hypothetical protein